MISLCVSTISSGFPHDDFLMVSSCVPHDFLRCPHVGVGGASSYVGVAGARTRKVFDNSTKSNHISSLSKVLAMSWQGVAGASSYVGVAGASSYVGVAGASSYVGVAGASSYVGVAGASCYVGVAGASSYVGVAGVAGASSYVGVAGVGVVYLCCLPLSFTSAVYLCRLLLSFTSVV
jgi:hypothetical protein